MLALSIQPSSADCHLAVGNMYKAKGMLNEALASLLKCHQLNSDDGGVREALATVLTDIGTSLKSAGRAYLGAAWC